MDISEVKYNLNKVVRVELPRHYIDSQYMLIGCIIRKNEKGEFFYQAELQDVKSKSLLITGLGDIRKE